MHWLILLFLAMFGQISATSIVMFGNKELSREKKAELLEVILKGEPPRVFYESTPFDMEGKVQAIDSELQLVWIPPTLWQLAALHSFFLDVEIRKQIVALPGVWWNPLSYDEKLKDCLPVATNHADVISIFDEHSRSIPDVEELFFRVNDAARKLYVRACGSDIKMIEIILKEIPPFSEWSKMQFPFWGCPYVQKPQAVDLFYKALMNKSLITELVKIERQAYDKGEWILYRGYRGTGFPSTIEIGTNKSHALSFGSTALGGVFFALEATALTYYTPDGTTEWSFLALRVTPNELKKFFRVGPIHPLIQMVSDGEMFHAHTKIAAAAPDAYSMQQMKGYFMKANRHCYDKTGHILSLDMTVDELEDAFQLLCERSGHIHSYQK